MARKTVTVKQPKNIDDAVVVCEKILQRNDGSLPTVPQSTLYITIGALVGVVVPVVATASTPAPPPPPPGTHKLSENLAAPMRALYPGMKRNYLDYVALCGLTASTLNILQTQLGFADGQVLATAGTVRNFVSRAIKALLAIYAGQENELETYGLAVTVGTASSPKAKTPPAGPTPP